MTIKEFLNSIFTSRTFWGWAVLLIVSTVILCFGKIDGTIWSAFNGVTFGAFVASNKIGDKLNSDQ